MAEMRHGKPADDEFGINDVNASLSEMKGKEDRSVFQEKPGKIEVPVFRSESRHEIQKASEIEQEEAKIPAVSSQHATRELVKPLKNKETVNRNMKERPLKREKAAVTGNQEKKRLSRSALVLIAGIVIIAIPVLIFIGILGISALQTGSPRIGSRFDGDLDPAIAEKELSDLKTELSAIASVEDVEVLLTQGQLKIFIDTSDSLSEEQVDSILMSAYNKVIGKYPIATYFTGDDSRKMYDLHIHVYTSATASAIGDDNGRQYKLLHKNSTEDTYGIDDMAHPKDPALAAELEGLTPEVNEEETEEGDGE
ncbi:MAG: hypothetical protein IJI44_03160 [Erysipelotrichaceae bacterium]|nr:hypothetical protein [Erysipelotrichaceae bacterium]